MSYERISEIMNESLELENGSTKVAMIQEAARLADELDDVECGYAVRMELIEAATFSDHDDVSLVAFTWCLAQWDKDPEIADPGSLLWKYKWILGDLETNYRISQQQISGLIEDYRVRLDHQGYSTRPAHYLQRNVCMRMGDFDAARSALQQWQAAPRDEMADCDACERANLAEYYMLTGNDERALQEVAPLLGGEMFCSVVPENTHAEMLEPMLRLGRFEEAKQSHKQGYRLISSDRNFVMRIPDHLFYLVWAGELDRALQILETHLPWVVETACLKSQMLCYLGGQTVLEALARRDSSPCRLRIPREWDCYREDDQYHPQELATWFAGRHQEYATRFDIRNGNNYISNRAEQRRQFALAGRGNELE